jgi:hypothetical protein
LHRRITLRFRFDSDDKTWHANPPLLEPNPKPNPDPEGLDPQQRIEFLRLLHDGLGRISACARLGISIRSLQSTLAECASFRRAIDQIELVRAEKLYSVLFIAALNGDTRAALFLLARHDREIERRATRPEK